MRKGFLILLCLSTTIIFSNDEERIFKTDAVALVQGEEVSGAPSFEAKHQGVTYLFASKANRDTFLKDPDRYALQLGGACARMGPLSGKGNPEIFTVHEEKLYVFGSQGCRDIFLEDPAKTFDPDQAPPHLRGRAATDGKLWIDKLAAAMGGERIDKLNTYTETYEEPTERRGKQYQHHVLNRIDFPDGFHHEDDWDDSRFHRTVKGDSGRFSGREGEWDMVPVQVRAMKREFLTQPLLLLRARTENGFLAATAGEETIEGKPAVKVIVAYRNFNQTLLIDKATHQLLAQRFRGRGQGALFAPMEKRYREYREIDGLMLPTQVETRQDDEVLRTENWRVSVR